ncbi:hypothetical protein LOTGIDRAFT_107213, partial [Lottia gigantea]
DYEVTVNTTDPDFTPCFQKTVLTWTPCVFLIFSAIVRVISLYGVRKHSITWTWLSKVRIFLGALIGIMNLMEFLYSLQEYADNIILPVVYFLTPLVVFITMIIYCFMINFERRKGIRNCGFMFVFWLLYTICGLVIFRSKIRHAVLLNEVRDEVRFSIFIVCYPIVVVQLILSIFVDKQPKNLPDQPQISCPENSASFISKITFWWFTQLVIEGYKKALERKDLWSLNYVDTSSHIVQRFDKYWQYESQCVSNENNDKIQFKDGQSYTEIKNGQRTYKPRLLICLIKTFGGFCLKAAIFKFIYDVLQFVSPQLLKLLINFTKDKDSYLWVGLFYAGCMFTVALIQSFILHQYFHGCFLLGMRIRTAIVSAVYRKTLVLSNTSRKNSTVGEIVNLMSVDAQRFMDLMTYFHTIWSGPLQIAIAIYFLWQTLGPSILAGLGVMILLIPINAVMANKTKEFQFEQMLLKDKRIKLMNEILNGIKVLKLYAWEPSFEEQVLGIRKEELYVLKKAAYLNAASSFTWTCAPVMVSLTTFAVYTLSSDENILDAEKAFVSLSLFNILRFPLSMLPQVITSIVQASVSLKRLDKFLGQPELDPVAVDRHSDKGQTISIENGTFTWETDLKPTLSEIDLEIKKGSLVAVVGAVGAGKSSFLSALLGEMEKTSGTVAVQGSVAYVQQQAWIQNETLQNNILFGKTLDKTVYDKVIYSCALQPDIEMLPGGDQTEIGEKGINLSGGQKQRVSVARALYQNTDIYLLDDPLSAVDSHVGKHIFDNVIGPNGLLNNKTRVLVTHGISYLPKVDKIVVLVDGRISEAGSFQELLDHNGAFSSFLKNYLLEEVGGDRENISRNTFYVLIYRSYENLALKTQLSESRTSLKESVLKEVEKQRVEEVKDVKEIKSAVKTDDKLIQAESVETGRVKFTVFSAYIKAVGPLLTVFIIFFFIMTNAAAIYSNIWLSEWSDDSILPNSTRFDYQRDMRLGVYAALGVLQGLFVLIAVLLKAIGARDASKILHKNFLLNVMRSPMKFFDTTPLGRLVNRFGKDVDVIDITIPQTIRMWLHCFLTVVSTFVVVSISTPYFMTVAIPLLILYYFIQRFYIATSRQLKRLESISRSPIYSHFGETVTGAVTIRAFGQQERFITESENKVDENQICYFPSITSNRWLAIRLEFIGNLIVFFASLFAVLGRESLSPGIVGLSISYALNVTQTLNFLVRMTCELETNIVAVERVKEYSETPTEADWIVENNRPDKEWPIKGEVEFSNFQLRYREGLDLVLKGIDCKIKSGEKIGIVGRTGAGKSSLTLALFRIIESAGGKITIDNINIADIGLHDLRSKLTIIPQDPVLFSGSLRMNLDPFEEFDDDKIWQALEHAHLKSFVTSLPAQLNHECSEGGENLSVGQRQLICLSRALLRKSRILILDEATAAIDLETDDLIQATIKIEFESCTVLTIAHRLNTILDYDRIMVLDSGRIKELDDPHNLLRDENTVFYGMAKDAGLV